VSTETYPAVKVPKVDATLVRKRFRLVCDAESKQREREREDLRFQVPEDQWDEDAKRERLGIAPNGTSVPPRPMVSIDLVRQPIQLLDNQFTRSRLSVNLHPVSQEADEELVEAYQGIYRRIERDGQADLARGWAYDRAVKCGRGWYRIVKRHDEDATENPKDPAFWDQEIGFEVIEDQFCVYVDPAAVKPDYSDARFLFVTAWMTEEEFKERYPDAEVPGSQAEWQSLGNQAPEWVNAAGDRPALVAEYWWKDVNREMVYGDAGRKRVREIVTVYCAHMSVLDKPLEVYEWDGKLFPFVPVSGEKLQPVDGDRRLQGIIRPARDPQRFANFAASSLVEGMSLEPKAPWMIPEGADEGYEHEYQQSNVRNFAALHYRPQALGDKLVPPPQRTQVDGTRMTLAMQAFQEAKGFVQSTTGAFQAMLGERPSNQDSQSGRAILALQQQGDAGTSQFMDRMKLVSIPYEAKVILDLIPHVYDRPGRVTSIVTGEDEAKTERIMLGRPFTTNPKGWPVASMPNAKGAKVIDLTKGKFGIAVEVGRPFQTRLQEGGEMLGEVLAKAPALMPLVGPTYFEFQDWPGAKEVAEILRKVRDQQYPFLVDDEDQNSPEAMAARAQAMQGQLQQLQQAYQQAAQALQTDQAKHQAQVEVAQIRAQVEMELAKLKAQLELQVAESKNAADITVARIKAATQAVSDESKLREEALATGLKLEADREARHEEMAHDVAMAHAGGRTVTTSRSQGRDGESEESNDMSEGNSAEHSAEEQPEPEPEETE